MVPAISSLGTSHMGLFSPKADQRSLPPLPPQGWSQESHEVEFTRPPVLPGPTGCVGVSLSRILAGLFTPRLTPEAGFPGLG